MEKAMISAFRRSAGRAARSLGLVRRLGCSLVFFTALAAIVLGQSGGAPSQAQDGTQQVPLNQVAKAVRENGIPVTDLLVMAKCGKCHARDEQGNMERISWERT